MEYGSYRKLTDALYERDRLMEVDWDFDLYVELKDTHNKYESMELPVFNHLPKYISEKKESWEVRSKGSEYKTLGTYNTLSDAQKASKLVDGRIVHHKKCYRVNRWVKGKTRHYGSYKTLSDAEEKVKELEEKGWG